MIVFASNALEIDSGFMATENILMAAVRRGGDRQELHEKIRVHSQAAGCRVKEEGAPNDLLDRLRLDDAFKGVDLDDMLDPARYVGRAPEQVDEFLAEIVEPITARYHGSFDSAVGIKV